MSANNPTPTLKYPTTPYSNNRKPMRTLFLSISLLLALAASALDHPGITTTRPAADDFTLIAAGQPVPVLVDSADNSAVLIAADNLRGDFARVCGTKAGRTPQSRAIIAGSLQSSYIKALVKAKKIDAKQLRGQWEKYIITTVKAPVAGIDEALVIAGSDRRGTVYGIYEISEQIGVSPWYDWMDVPATRHRDLAIARGTYTAGSPAVRYRGIFLNDEAPCLTSWVKNTYGTRFGDHRFYGRVFELLLRLRANMMWPAMWMWSFYADDPLNSKTADDMGIIMGTSHHEPMARNHQEWARHRKDYGAWDYETNQATIDKFFREGIERSRDNEDLITIGMRGDGDTAMGGKEGHDDEATAQDDKNIALLRKIFTNQRNIIAKATGRPAKERPQVWAVYKEVQRYYDMGLRAPDDVITLLSDDNWGDVKHVPTAAERKQKGGFGLYYHVDYVGAPRNTKWLNVTPIQNMWEQLQLAYGSGIDKLWVLNVGDLKPMEYPITLFLDMAWNPSRFTTETLLDHSRDFCRQQFGKRQANEAARLLNLYCKMAGRCTPEMLDKDTYDIASGEWQSVVGEWKALETEALRQYMTLRKDQKDAYAQLLLFPIQAFGNLHEMYYSQAMNQRLADQGDDAANNWADNTARCFRRDSLLCADYNNAIAGGKWRGMMTQKHIGYKIWDDNFPRDILPPTKRVEKKDGGYVFQADGGYVSIEAPHYFEAKAKAGKWTEIPFMGRTLGAMALMPYTEPTDGAAISYRMQLPEATKKATVHVVVKSTLPFARKEGHRFRIGFDGAKMKEVSFNERLNEDQENVYSIMYPTVARRIVDKEVELEVPQASLATLTIEPIEPGLVVEKIVVDFGGYKPQYLFGRESPKRR